MERPAAPGLHEMRLEVWLGVWLWHALSFAGYAFSLGAAMSHGMYVMARSAVIQRGPGHTPTALCHQRQREMGYERATHRARSTRLARTSPW